jgi:hypothetical protein
MDIIKDLPADIIPAELWKAFSLILLALVAWVGKRNLDEMKESNKEFKEQILKLTINDAVQDERIDALEEAKMIVKYSRK